MPHTLCFGQTWRVSWSSTISLGGALYSVPSALVDERVRARMSALKPAVCAIDARRARELAFELLTSPSSPSAASGRDERRGTSPAAAAGRAREPAGAAAAAPVAMRRRSSRLPAGKTLDAWEQRASPIPTQTQQALTTLERVSRAENLCVCGPSSTGKRHFVEMLGHLAIDKGKTVAWHTLETLAALLRRHRADATVARRSEG
jgi:DNA replication protein DnaC